MIAIVLLCYFASFCFSYSFKQDQILLLSRKLLTSSPRLPPSSTSIFMANVENFGLLTSILRRVDPAQAKGECFFFFFGGSGALGIGFAQLPKLIKDWNRIRKLNGPTVGGAPLVLGPIATLGYPEMLRVGDVQKIIDDMPEIETIVQNGPKNNYVAQLGYIEREGFIKCFSNDTNPLALQAVYDALSEGGGDLASPVQFKRILDEWTYTGIEGFKKSLTLGQARKYSAIGVFFFLIALVIDLIFESGINAFL